ncbi:cache domain-containing protein [Nonomuraea sp. NPDC050790]|uniref:cache domain-containing protein n=1 Tax=Nonomuraea sp. NPDC050790 TaxID=3364371 RepID=UPI0037ADF84A
MADPRLDRVADRIHTIIEGVFSSLEEIRAAAVACYRPELSTADLVAIRPQIFGCLRRSPDVLAGAGLILAPGVLADRPRWLEWWQAPDPTFLDVDLNPDSLDFYDYTAAEWFAVPERTRRRHVVGPYVDYGGTDTYMLTLTTPVEVERRFLGVVGADVRAARFEELLLGVLSACSAEVALVNAEGRVVAANSPRRPSGSLLAMTGGDPLPSLPWRLMSLETTTNAG